MNINVFIFLLVQQFLYMLFSWLLISGKIVPILASLLYTFKLQQTGDKNRV